MLSAEQRRIRAHGIGSSEIGIIAGCSPHSTVHQLWLEKTGLAEPANDTRPELLVGQFLEDGAAQMYAHIARRFVVNPQRTYTHVSHPWALATPDRLVAEVKAEDVHKDIAECDGVSLLEIKLPGRWAKGWDFAAEDGLPQHVLCQAQWQMEITGIHRCDVFAVAGTEPRIFTVEYDAGFCNDLIAIAEEFWFQRVIPRIPPAPDGTEEASKALRARFPKDNGLMLPATVYARDLADRLRSCKRIAKEAQENLALLEQEAKAHTGDASGVDGLWTWKEKARGTQWKQVALELNPPPELIAKHQGTPTREFRLKGER